MKYNKIAGRLIIYFAIALLTFSLVVGMLFLNLFSEHTTKIYKNDLEQRATNIADNLSVFMEASSHHKTDNTGVSDNNVGQGQGQGQGYGAYMRFLGDIAMTDVWIIDENLQLVTKGNMNHHYTYKDLPSDANEVIQTVFSGATTFSEKFSGLIGSNTLTVGTPIYDGDGHVLGVVLLHSPIQGIDSAIRDGFASLVVSIGVSLVIAGIAAVLLSYSFVSPLNKLKKTALLLADGDYTAKTGVLQKDEIGELANVIDIMSERLLMSVKESERLEQLRNDFVANVSHELRTPITVIRGSLEALCDGVVSEPSKVREYHAQMLNESKSLQRLVADLLDLTKLQNYDFKIELRPLNICELIDDAIRGARRIASEKNIVINKEINTDKSEVTADYDRLRQLIIILVDNAIKFSHQGGIIEITLYYQNSLCLTIKDYGTGISQESLPYLFDRFHKTKDASNTTGSGLGLAIAKQIALRHNIHIAVESIVNEYSIFTLVF